MLKQGNRAPHPDPLWIFQLPNSSPNTLSNSLQCVEQQLNWLMRQLTPDMERILKKRQEKPHYACQFCGEVFQKGCALGGHMSKRHTNKKIEESQTQRLGQNSSTMMPNHKFEFISAEQHFTGAEMFAADTAAIHHPLHFDHSNLD